MSDQDKREAKEIAKRGARQGRHAGRNMTRAAQLAGEAAAEDTKDTLMHAADGAREVAGDVADEVKNKAPRLSATGLAAISSDTGVGFLALGVSIYSGALAYYKFRSAFQGRGRAVNP